MNRKYYMPIKEFSRLTGIRKENLRFYDQIGLLSPETRGENGYRYYSWEQLESAFLIYDLRTMGVSIEEIKQYAKAISPTAMQKLFVNQTKLIQKEIERLRTMQDLMNVRIKMVKQALEHEEEDIFLETKKKEPIFLTEVFDSEISYEDKIMQAYDDAAASGINISSPFGFIVGHENNLPILRGYFKTFKKHNSYKPQGTYAVAYGRCNYRETKEILKKLISFIKKEGLTVNGDVYEEYPLDSLAIKDGEPFGVRLEVAVK